MVLDKHLRLKTLKACKVVGVNPVTLLAAVRDGHYRCAPTEGRAGRVFGPDDLVALYYFGWHVRQGSGTQHAGQMAAALRRGLKVHRRIKPTGSRSEDFCSLVLAVDFSGNVEAHRTSEAPSVEFGHEPLECRSINLFSIELRLLRRLSEEADFPNDDFELPTEPMRRARRMWGSEGCLART